MNATKFLASGVSIVLPTKSSPKVFLAIDNPGVAIQSYKLYNPFSLKAKLLKYVTQLIAVNLNSLAKAILPTITHESSHFIQELEATFNQKLQSSVYVSTANDKIVLQLQNDGKIIGYLKYAISTIGEKRILNEQKAIQILTNFNLAPKILHADLYEKKHYIVLQNIEGSIGRVTTPEYSRVLESLQKENKYKLKDHPRIHQIITKLNANELEDISQLLVNEFEYSNELYKEVFEHGDFAPWNLIKLENKVVAFDYEYFEEKGLQYLDEIKYHFQLYHLMDKKIGEALINSIANKISIKEFNSVFLVYLAKEIVNNKEAGEPYVLESSLLKLLPLQLK